MADHFPYACRLNSFKSRPDLYRWTYGHNDVRDLIARAGKVKDLNALVLNYPEHFDLIGEQEVRSALKASNLRLQAMNVRFPSVTYADGILMNPDVGKRKQAIALLKEGVDLCKSLGADQMVMWLSTDGFDYPFQVDYKSAWEQECDGVREVAEFAKDLKISLEYKPTDPRKRSLLADMASTLLLIHECKLPNLGVTIDYCHSLVASENPAYAASLAARSGLLFGVHLNDGYGYHDDGLMVASATYVQTAELLFYLMQFGYQDVVYFDTFPVREDPVQECAANMMSVESICNRLDSLDRRVLAEAQAAQDALAVRRVLYEALFR